MPRAIPVAAAATAAQGFTGPAVLVGYAVRETGTAAGTVQLRDGTSAAGALVACATVPQGTSFYAQVPAVDIASGVFVDRTGTGVTEVVLYVL